MLPVKWIIMHGPTVIYYSPFYLWGWSEQEDYRLLIGDNRKAIIITLYKIPLFCFDGESWVTEAYWFDCALSENNKDTQMETHSQRAHLT